MKVSLLLTIFKFFDNKYYQKIKIKLYLHYLLILKKYANKIIIVYHIDHIKYYL